MPAQRVPLLLLLWVAAACTSTRGLYGWGAYDDSVHDVIVDEGSVDLDREIQRMVELVEKAVSLSRRVPPGLHAHLGYLYYLRGDVDSATAAFLSEKEIYPESTVFVDGLLARMKGAS